MDVQRLASEIDTLESRWYKILYIVGYKKGDDKHIAMSLEFPFINLNLLLSKKLTDIPKSNYPLQVGEILDNIFKQYRDSIIWLGNIEILFDKQLKQYPVKLLENLSKRYKLVVSWPGKYDGKYLIYGAPEHPEYFTCNEFEGKIVTI